MTQANSVSPALPSRAKSPVTGSASATTPAAMTARFDGRHRPVTSRTSGHPTTPTRTSAARKTTAQASPGTTAQIWPFAVRPANRGWRAKLEEVISSGPKSSSSPSDSSGLPVTFSTTVCT